MHEHRILRAPRAAAIAAVLVFAGCASAYAAQARRDYLKEQLKDHEIQESLDVVWPQVMNFLAENGFELGGKDREKVGQSSKGLLSIFSRASETKDIGRNQQALESDWSNDKIRYRVEGTRTGAKSCRVQFFLIKQDDAEANHEKMVGRDNEAELALLRRIEPDRAAPIDEKADALEAQR